MREEAMNDEEMKDMIKEGIRDMREGNMHDESGGDKRNERESKGNGGRMIKRREWRK